VVVVEEGEAAEERGRGEAAVEGSGVERKRERRSSEGYRE